MTIHVWRRNSGAPSQAAPGMVQAYLTAQAKRLLSPVSALALALLPGSVSGQARTSRPDEVVWHWFGVCAGSDSLVLEVHFDGRSLYSSTFPICHARRAEIKPEPQQRILEFRFDGEPHRFRTQYRATGTQLIEGNIWEAGRERHGLRLGVSFSTEQQVLLNTIHVARADSPSRSERIRGLVITTRPVRRGDGTPPNKRLKLTDSKLIHNTLVRTRQRQPIRMGTSRRK